MYIGWSHLMTNLKCNNKNVTFQFFVHGEKKLLKTTKSIESGKAQENGTMNNITISN